MVLATRYPGGVPIELFFPERMAVQSRAPIDGLSTSWLARLATDGRAASTLKAYRGDVVAFQDWARANGVRHWAQVDTAIVASYLASEHAREIGLRLVARRVNTIQALFRHAITLGHELLALRIRPKEPEKLAITARPEDIDRVIRCLRGDDFFAVRNRAVLEMIYGCGVASNELCDLDLDCIDVKTATLRVESRYLLSRRVPVNRRTLDAVRAWLAIRRSVSVQGSELALFTSAAGFRLTQDSLGMLVVRASIAAGIVPPLTPRSLRNSFGVHLLEHGADESQVAAMMGLSLRRAIQLRRATDPRTRGAGAALRALSDARADPPQDPTA